MSDGVAPRCDSEGEVGKAEVGDDRPGKVAKLADRMNSVGKSGVRSVGIGGGAASEGDER